MSDGICISVAHASGSDCDSRMPVEIIQVPDDDGLLPAAGGSRHSVRRQGDTVDRADLEIVDRRWQRASTSQMRTVWSQLTESRKRPSREKPTWQIRRVWPDSRASCRRAGRSHSRTWPS